MKKLAIVLGILFFCLQGAFADEVVQEPAEELVKENETVTVDKSNQVIEMEDNKINVIVMKQPLNEKSNQKIILKRNWLGVYVQINGKVKVNPLTSTYEVE